ncbi:hypothetical protein OTSTA763_1837 [Orientia tsutsugamushi str. TA763]|nr:hypothetical protein OTSTA763_1837 [Orientia tsutsugamushi str. TA763]
MVLLKTMIQLLNTDQLSEAYHNKGLTLAFLGQLQNAIEHLI